MKKDIENGMSARLSIKLPSKLLKMVQEKSKRTGVPISFRLRSCLEDWLNESIKFYFSSKEDREKGKPIIDEQIGHILWSTNINDGDEIGYEIGLRDAVTITRIETVTKMLGYAYQIHNVRYEVPYNSDN